ncbi:hypothetical protein [Methyloversatilis sp.]|uniref:hypothetical protein n=1 Tax=Methyloversatilis sp. TaxID=2569862 RepID=UPI003D2DEBCF
MRKALKIGQVLGVLGMGLGVAGLILQNVDLAMLLTPGFLLFVVCKLVAWITSDKD